MRRPPLAVSLAKVERDGVAEGPVPAAWEVEAIPSGQGDGAKFGVTTT